MVTFFLLCVDGIIKQKYYCQGKKEGDGMKIRLANHSDIPSICMLYEKFYEYNAEQQPNCYLAAKESGGYPKGVIDGSNGDIFVAEEHGEILGFIHVEQEATPPYASVAHHKFTTIVDFYVDPQYRKKGIGKALLEKVKSWAKERSLDYLELFVLEENRIGQCFYNRENFVSALRALRYPL